MRVPLCLRRGIPDRIKCATVGVADAIPPPHDASEDVDQVLHAAFSPSGVFCPTRTAGAPPLPELISTNELVLRLGHRSSSTSFADQGRLQASPVSK
jgi:hypothetical protein